LRDGDVESGVDEEGVVVAVVIVEVDGGESKFVN
tara:strand:- start:2 stop:103 length:102 start_codon:yes stop_codon:yes gene_type:complete